MDRAISVLVIGGSLPDGEGGSRVVRIDFPGRAETADRPDLQIIHAPNLEEATRELRTGAIDTVLLNQGEAETVASVRAHAADLPILMLARESAIEIAQAAIAQGADDVLLPTDLAGDGLERRVSLAIARKSYETDRLRHAREDAVTGLANGTLLEERFVRAMARADRSSTLVGLVAIDLDGFDDVVARHGRSVADRLLSLVGMRLLGETRQTDTLARTRDHGFTWMVEGLASIDDISALVNRLPASLNEPFSVDDRTIRLTASGGVAICPLHGRDFATVQGMAEAAMLDVSAISGDGLLMLPVPLVSKPLRPTAVP